jgi:ribosomal protein S18 acetylase RimI-like enzyme
MAALSDRRSDSLIPLRNVRPEQLTPLLEEEVEEWRSLSWDFRASADLVRRFSAMQALEGFVLLAGPRVAGFTYSVSEEGKGLIGDLYVQPEYRTLEREDMLLQAVLDSMWRTPGMRRIEAQLLMLSSPLNRRVPYLAWFQQYPRLFLEADLADIAALPSRESKGAVIMPWHEHRHDEAARVIAAAYVDHIDSQINDQYRSPAGARRFLTNIIQYPGCGLFFPSASFLGIDRDSLAPAGVCLASMVAEDAGHITQVCVTPKHRSTGLGYELMRRSLVALARHGARTASLTVTSSNAPAIRLYQRMGFAVRRNFAAYVWDKQ